MAHSHALRDNDGMKEDLRLVFSLLWFPAVGCTFAGGMLFVLTFGEYGMFFLWSAIACALATAGVLVTSLD